MARAPYRVFISRVSSEFALVSTAIASDLRARGIEVKVQEDFTQGHTAETWLGRLEEYIRDCQAVICIHGQRSGGFPGATAIEPYLSFHPPELSRISYTQWEYFFTLHHRKKPFIYIADPTWSADKPASTGDDPVSQKAFLDYLRHPADRKSQPFDSALKLQNLVLREKWPDHPVVKPSNLPGGYIGRIFLGRDEFLTTLRQSLLGTGHATAITQKSAATGISGLGGIGKTHAAVEYAHRHRDDYTALLFASGDTPEKLNSSLANLCTVLRLDESGNLPPEEAIRIRAVLDWLITHHDWLLIIDNADDKPAALAVQEVLGELTNGHVLITTRLHGWSDQITSLDLEVLSEASSIELLLNLTAERRRLAPDDEAQVRQLAQFLEGLPLAIHQAAGFINEHTLTFAQYVTRYETEAADLLNWFNELSIPYAGPEELGPRPVLITWKTSFDQISDDDRFWLLVFSLFAPEPIPEFLLEPLEEASLVQKSVIREASNAIAHAENYCLLSRSRTEPFFKIHRLVQQIIRIQSTPDARQSALETAISMIHHASPGDPLDVQSWPKWNSLQPHAVSICEHFSDDSAHENLIWMLAQLGSLYNEKALFKESERHRSRALALAQLIFQEDHPLVALQLNNLAHLLKALDRFEEAEPLMFEGLRIARLAHGKDHPHVAIQLNNLAQLFKATNRLPEAEPLMREALRIDRSALMQDPRAIATRLTNLAALFLATDRIVDAEPLMLEALSIDRDFYGDDHPEIAIDLNNLAQLLQATDRLSEAEPMMRDALRIDLAAYGSEHPKVATRLNNLARLLHDTNRFSEAEPMMREALRIDRAAYGEEHSIISLQLNNLAGLLHFIGRHAEAEPLILEALHIDRTAYGNDHPAVARDLNDLAQVIQGMYRLSEAETLLREALRILQVSLGSDHPNTATVARNLKVLHAQMESSMPGTSGGK